MVLLNFPELIRSQNKWGRVGGVDTDLNLEGRKCPPSVLGNI